MFVGTLSSYAVLLMNVLHSLSLLDIDVKRFDLLSSDLAIAVMRGVSKKC